MDSENILKLFSYTIWIFVSPTSFTHSKKQNFFAYDQIIDSNKESHYPLSMKIIIKSDKFQKQGVILLLFILILCIITPGCIQIPTTNNKTSDIPPSVMGAIPFHTPEPTPTSNQIFSPDMTPDIREKLMREDKIPTTVNKGTPTPPSPSNSTSHVIRQNDTYPNDYYIPSRKSIYFSNTSSTSIPGQLHPIYTESGIPLNYTIKNLQVNVQNGPFSVRYSVHPKGNPLVSWAKITIMDPFQNIVHQDGYNREFSSEGTKEFIVYQNGTVLLQIIGEAANLDLTINTPDGTIQSRSSSSTQKKNVPANIPTEIRERQMREGKI
jgi:hypothetical protein